MVIFRKQKRQIPLSVQRAQIARLQAQERVRKKIGNTKFFSGLFRRLESSKSSPMVKRYVLGMLARYVNYRSIWDLNRVLLSQNEDFRTRRFAADALFEIARRKGGNKVEEFLIDSRGLIEKQSGHHLADHLTELINRLRIEAVKSLPITPVEVERYFEDLFKE